VIRSADGTPLAMPYGRYPLNTVLTPQILAEPGRRHEKIPWSVGPAVVVSTAATPASASRAGSRSAAIPSE
jgi:hypothetical protein